VKTNTMPDAQDQYEARAWLVTLPSGWWSVHLEQTPAIAYAARNHGICEPLYRKIPPAQKQEGKRHD
jgi:hypothetical protein